MSSFSFHGKEKDFRKFWIMGFYVPIQNAGIVETHVKENDDDDDEDNER